MAHAIFAGDDKVEISKAILLYGSHNKTSYATVHGITMGMKGMALAEGQPMTQAALVEIVNSLSNSVQRTGLFIPENVLSMGVDSVVWYVRPSDSRRVWFKCADKKIGERNGLTPQPGLVFAAGACGWNVFAFKGNGRPTPTTPLYLAPYFNVWANGKVCQGSVEVPKACSLDNYRDFENAFFESMFSHPNVHKDLVKYRGGAYSLWKALLDGKFGNTFPEKVLVPTKLTLNDFLKQTVGGGQ